MKQSKKRPGKAKEPTIKKAKEPTIKSLRVFVELGDKIKAAERQGTTYKSPTAAAEAMRAKANVFRVLAYLREVYGDRPLMNYGSTTLTPEGEAVYAWAKTLLQLYAKGRQWPIGDRELIRIGTSNWILNFLVPEIVRAFLEKRGNRKLPSHKTPNVDLVFAEYDVEQLLVDLRKGTVHAGLAAVLTAGPWPGLAVETLRQHVDTVMIASAQHQRWGKDARKRRTEVVLDEVAGETICVIEADLYTVLAGLRKLTQSGSRILVENYASVISLVRTGVAVGFIPQLHIGKHPSLDAYEGLEVYHLHQLNKDREKESLPPRKLAILRRAGEDLPAEVEEFLKVARAKLGDNPE